MKENPSLDLKIEKFDDIYDRESGRFKKEFADVLVEHYNDLHKKNEPKKPVGDRMKEFFKDSWEYIRKHKDKDDDDKPIPVYKVNLMVEEGELPKIPENVAEEFKAFCERKKEKYQKKADLWNSWNNRITLYGTLSTTYGLMAAALLKLIEISIYSFTLVGAIPDIVLISGQVPKHFERKNREKERYFDLLEEHADLHISVYKKVN